MNLLIYYNTNYNNFYIVYTYIIPFNRKVGYINSYGHILVQILVNRNNKLINILSYDDLRKIPYGEDSLKIRIIDKLIRWLYKLKRRG